MRPVLCEIVYESTRFRYDVLFMTEPLDELTVQAIGEYGGKALSDLGKENVDLAGDEEEKLKKEEQSTETEGESRRSVRRLPPSLPRSLFIRG